MDGCFVAGIQSEDAGRDQFVLIEPVTVVLGPDQGGDQVIARMGSPVGQ